MTQASYDVVIAGGGAVGSAVAWFLRGERRAPLSVALIEPDPAYRFASTTLSAASIRQQFSTRENIALSQFGLEFFRTLKPRFGDDADIGFREHGYLYLGAPGSAAIMRENNALQRSMGADIVLLEPDELACRFPDLDVDGVEIASLGLSGEGWYDAHSLLMLMRKGAIAAGAEYITDRVEAIVAADGRVTGARLASGRTISCGAFVNAAGAWAGDLAATAGVALPVEPRKRSVFVFACRADIAMDNLLIDTSGIWARRESGRWLAGWSPHGDEADPRGEDLEVDHHIFEEIIWPALARRVPAFEAIRAENAWAGFYDYNTVDQNAVIGPHPELANLFFANGFSGHGLQQAPATGRAIAELILDGAYQSLDLAIFGFDRFAANRPVIERNVI
ncbi:MAG: NAD(P)/FAD-dependent oxidoreductase [Flavobacteriaceae bacterium]